MNVTIRDQRSQVGIGTLMVFIAMVLVASIAAGVLLESSGYLRSSALATGEESAEQTQDSLIVLSSSGQLNTVYDVDDTNVVLNESGFAVLGTIVDSDDVLANVVREDGENMQIDNFFVDTLGGDSAVTETSGNFFEQDGSTGVIVRDDDPSYNMILGSGNNIIESSSANENVVTDVTESNVVADFDPDFSDNTVISEGNKLGQISLTVAKGPGSGPIPLDDVTLEYLSPYGVTQLVREGTEGSSNVDTFTTASVTNVKSENTIINRGDHFKIIIDLDASSGALQPLKEGEEAQITLMSPSGSTRTTQVRVVDSFAGGGKRVE